MMEGVKASRELTVSIASSFSQSSWNSCWPSVTRLRQRSISVCSLLLTPIAAKTVCKCSACMHARTEMHSMALLLPEMGANCAVIRT